MEMPPGASPAFAWTIITMLRYQTAIKFPFRFLPSDSCPALVWYTITHEMEQEIREIMALGGPTSHLQGILQRHKGGLFDMQDQVEELVAAVKLDGGVIDYESAREMLVQERNPRTPVERIAANYQSILAEASTRNGLTTAAGMKAVYADLVAGVGVGEAEPVNKDDMNLYATLMAGPSSAYRAPIVCFSIHLHEVPKFHRPFRQWNATYASLLRRLFLVRSGFPVLSLVPLSKLVRDWQNGEIGSPPYRLGADPCPIEDACDATPYMAGYIDLMRIGLKAVEQRATDIERYEEDLRGIVRAAQTINYRQRDVLLAALDNPRKRFRINEHQETWQAAYATARADLLGLASLGFMHIQKEGKALVFFAASDFRNIIERRLGARR
ncbi:MAG: hypothetical protein AB2L09_11840 [Coriobacteriia bacterium]